MREDPFAMATNAWDDEGEEAFDVLPEDFALLAPGVTPPRDPVLQVVREMLAFPFAAIGRAGLEDIIFRPGVCDGWGDVFCATNAKDVDGIAAKQGYLLLRSGPVCRKEMRNFVRLVMAWTRMVRVRDFVEAQGLTHIGSPVCIAGLPKRSDRMRWAREHAKTGAWSSDLIRLVIDGAGDVYAHWWAMWVNHPELQEEVADHRPNVSHVPDPLKPGEATGPMSRSHHVFGATTSAGGAS